MNTTSSCAASDESTDTHQAPLPPRQIEVLYNATYARVGGGLSYATSQVRALASEPDINLTVLTSPMNHEALSGLCAKAGAKCRLVRAPAVPLRWAWEQLMLPLVARRFDLLVCSGNFLPLVARTPTLLVLQTAALVGTGRHSASSVGKRLKVLLSHMSMRRADDLVVISGPLAAEVRSEPRLRGVDPVVIRSGTPPLVARTHAGLKADRSTTDQIVGPGPYLLSVAHDYPHKRLDDLGDLASCLGPASEVAGDGASGPASLPALRIVVVGSVSEDRRAAIRARARSGVDRLVFVGTYTDQKVIRALYTCADVAVTTSELEAWNFSIHEATSVGTRMVATDLPSHRELGDGRVHLYSTGDIEALAAAVTEALSRPEPAPWVPDWTWQDHGRAMAERIRHVAQAGTRR